MKRTPTLEFRYDDSIDHGMRITELLDEREPGEWE
jgi:ribosome-binding factor A